MLHYNERCPAGCRDLALPATLASVDTVAAGHAHYYDWRSSVGWYQLKKGELLRRPPRPRTRVTRAPGVAIMLSPTKAEEAADERAGTSGGQGGAGDESEQRVG